MGGTFRDRFQSELHHPLHVLVSDFARGSRTRLIQQAIDATSDEPLTPKSNRKGGSLQLPGNCRVALAATTLQNDPGPETQGPLGARLLRQSLQFLSLRLAHHQFVLLRMSTCIGPIIKA